MATNRKAAEKLILETVDKWEKGTVNSKMYKEMFSEMSDAKFKAWIDSVYEGKDNIRVYANNFGKINPDVKNNIKILRSMGFEPYQRPWVTDEHTGEVFLSPIRYPCWHLPWRRLAQDLMKKISIPKDNNHRDDLTNQPTGVSKGSKISFPEAGVFSARNLPYTAMEGMKARGGDQKAYTKFRNDLITTGEVSMEEIMKLNSVPSVIVTVNTFLNACHLESTLLKGR